MSDGAEQRRQRGIFEIWFRDFDAELDTFSQIKPMRESQNQK